MLRTIEAVNAVFVQPIEVDRTVGLSEFVQGEMLLLQKLSIFADRTLCAVATRSSKQACIPFAVVERWWRDAERDGDAGKVGRWGCGSLSGGWSGRCACLWAFYLEVC